MDKTVRVIIAEPSAIIRCGIITLLQQSSSLRMDVTQVSDLSTLATGVQKFIPDLLIVNPQQVGTLALSQLKVDLGNEELKVIALQSTFMDQSALQNYDEVLSIYDTVERIQEKIEALTKREASEEDAGRKELSAREREIIVHVVKGMTNKQIAEALFLSTHTVIAHRRNIANKLQISSSSGLTIYAIVNKLVDLSEVKNSITKTKE